MALPVPVETGARGLEIRKLAKRHAGKGGDDYSSERTHDYRPGTSK